MPLPRPLTSVDSKGLVLRAILSWAYIQYYLRCHCLRHGFPYLGFRIYYLPQQSAFHLLAISIDCYSSRSNSNTGGFYPLCPAVTSTVGFWPTSFLIMRFYQTSRNITKENFHWTFNAFIFTKCMSTIHLSLSASRGIMHWLAPLFKSNSALHCALCSW